MDCKLSGNIYILPGKIYLFYLVFTVKVLLAGKYGNKMYSTTNQGLYGQYTIPLGVYGSGKIYSSTIIIFNGKYFIMQIILFTFYRNWKYPSGNIV